MKLLTIIGLMTVSFASLADPQMQMMGMDPAKIQQMQKAMVEMQACMQNINKDDIEKLKARGQEMKQEIKSLCQAGKRSAAQNKAIAYSKEMMNTPQMAQMKKCTEQVSSMMPDMVDMGEFDPEKYKNKNVCDEIK